MSLFLRIIQHLLPTGEAWRTTIDKALRRLFDGLSTIGADARAYIDLVYLDLFPETTRQLGEWERFYGLSPSASTTEASRRLALSAEWKATGGQSAWYIQSVLRAAGFDVYVFSAWESESPWVARDPRDYLTSALLGTTQCGEALAQCGEAGAVCGTTLVNDPSYLVNVDLTSRAQPPLPSDPARWPHFMYVGGETFGDVVLIPVERWREFERLVLKLRPLHAWVGLFADSVEGFLATEDDELLLTEDDQNIAA
jgi:hypothetical protein